MSRLSKPHFKRGILSLLGDDPEKKEEALALIDAYSKTKQEDIDKLVDVVKSLSSSDKCRLESSGRCATHKTNTDTGICPHHRAKMLIERFEGGLGARLVFSKA